MEVKLISPIRALVVAAATAALSASALPMVDIIAGPQGNIGENVLFNDTPEIGNPIEGNMNQTGQAVLFSSSGTISGSGGQATVTGVDANNPFSTLKFWVPGWTFTEALMNLDATANGSISFLVNYLDPANQQYSETLTLDLNGANWFYVQATGGAQILDVSFTSLVNNVQTPILNEGRQFRIGGLEIASVPDSGSTMLLVAGAILFLSGLRRRMALA